MGFGRSMIIGFLYLDEYVLSYVYVSCCCGRICITNPGISFLVYWWWIPLGGPVGPRLPVRSFAIDVLTCLLSFEGFHRNPIQPGGLTEYSTTCQATGRYPIRLHYSLEETVGLIKTGKIFLAMRWTEQPPYGVTNFTKIHNPHGVECLRALNSICAKPY